MAQQISVCGYYGENAKYSTQEICRQLGFENTQDAEEKISSIMDQIGLQMNFLVVECNSIRNAFALNMEGDIGLIRYIIYDTNFLKSIEMRTQSDWSAISILAHEIGHHLNGHTLDSLGSRPPKELEADEFSGFALHNLGASLEEAQAAIRKISTDKASETHPAKADRLHAIAEGWRNAKHLSTKYKELSRNADFTSYAKKWFQKAYDIAGNMEQDHINRIAYYGKAIEYRADYSEAHRNKAKYLNILADFHRSERLFKEAQKSARMAISIDANLWNAYVELAISYLGLNQKKKSLELYNQVIDNREEPMASDFAGRGTVYARMAKRVEAIQDFKKALEIEPDMNYAKDQLDKLSK